MTTVDAQVEANLGPFRTAVELITSIPGIKNLGAHVIVSEIGIDMSRFPSAAHLLSWACICPRNDESAGKRRSNRMLKDGTMYNDLGSDHFVRHSTDQQKNRLVKRLTDLGYAVEIKPLAA
jgi:transposase